MARLLLLVPAVTYRATAFLLAAGRLGLDLVIGSDGAMAMGGPVVHIDHTVLDRSIDRLIAAASPLDAVVAADTSMLVLAAATAARLGLPHNPVAAVRATLDKAQQRCRWAVAGVPQPPFRLVPSGSEERAITRAAAEVGFPCVLKAVSLSGSQGVLRADSAVGAVAAARRIRGVLAAAGRPACEPLLVEAYVPGQEISIDGLLADGALTAVAVFDKPATPNGPTFEETLLISPPRLPVPVLTSALDVAGRAARALGLRHGPVHAELRIDPRDGNHTPTMLELAARSIGGLCSRVLRFPDGTSLEERILAHALGRAVMPTLLRSATGVLMLPVAQAGVLRAVEGRAEAIAVPGITGLTITIPIGQVVQPLPEGDRYLGFVFAMGATASAVEAALRTAQRHLRAIID